MFTSASTIAPQNAAGKLATRNPGTSADASSIMIALMISQNNPNVRMVNGNVMIFRKKPRVPFARPIR